ncbi:GNAT family N-acetyltransferase [Corynebacterium sp. A21]|uniref:GNAT family N-acetyltransferase n=1 Tax=Corynebacterium sp. A21 TaxID=3457318 RepID=UPI003FD3A183
MISPKVQVSPVRSRAELREFINLPLTLGEEYQQHHVPVLRSDINRWFRGKGWFRGVDLLLARAGGVPVGRAITHRSAALDAKLGIRAQLFGALDAVDKEVVAALLREVEQRGRLGGCHQIFGPVTPLPNVTGGAVTSGFEHPGFMDSTWNPPSIPVALESAGYQRWGQADTWEVPAIPVMRAPTAAEWGKAKLVYPGRFGLAKRLLPVLNAAFEQLPYYTRITPAQLKSQTSGLELLMDRTLIPLVEIDGEVVCFALVIPDPVEILRTRGGRLGFPELRRLLRNRPRDAVLIIQGTRPEYQGQGLLSLLTRQLYSNLRAGGYQRLRVTFIGRDNPASVRVFEKFGGRRLHGISFYLKDL